MSLYPSVRNVRQLKRGVQADVVIGEDPERGLITVTVVSNAPAVQRALGLLKGALEDEALAGIRGAVANENLRATAG